jgi:hypothetical protein
MANYYVGILRVRFAIEVPRPVAQTSMATKVDNRLQHSYMSQRDYYNLLCLKWVEA